MIIMYLSTIKIKLLHIFLNYAVFEAKSGSKRIFLIFLFFVCTANKFAVYCIVKQEIRTRKEQCYEYTTNAGGYTTTINLALSYDDYFGADSGVCQGYEYTNVSGYSRIVTLWYYGAGDSNNTLTLEQRDACTAQVLDCVARNTP